ncbi:MAG: hypothetical protein KA155_08835, partial [Alphaproteobacteria bacterium]|nr:hypothetical protein [Alphaproteobacteria bacterium]
GAIFPENTLAMITKLYTKVLGKIREASVFTAHFLHRVTHDYSYVDGVIQKYKTPELKKEFLPALQALDAGANSRRAKTQKNSRIRQWFFYHDFC